MVLASDKINPKIAFDISQRFLEDYGQLPLARDVVMSSLEGREMDMLHTILSKNGEVVYNQNQEIFLELLATSIAKSASEPDISALRHTAELFKDAANTWVKDALLNGAENVKPDFVVNLSHSLNIKPEIMSAGRQKYINICASCHGTNGAGMKRFAPPLRKSKWVTGDDQKLAMLLLHGMQGPVEVDGITYDTPDILPEMPSFSTLQNKDIAAIATYIRNAWGNAADEVTIRTVGSVRFRTQGKITPWTPTELDTLVFDLDL